MNFLERIGWSRLIYGTIQSVHFAKKLKDLLTKQKVKNNLKLNSYSVI